MTWWKYDVFVLLSMSYGKKWFQSLSFSLLWNSSFEAKEETNSPHRIRYKLLHHNQRCYGLTKSDVTDWKIRLLLCSENPPNFRSCPSFFKPSSTQPCARVEAGAGQKSVKVGGRGGGGEGDLLVCPQTRTCQAAAAALNTGLKVAHSAAAAPIDGGIKWTAVIPAENVSESREQTALPAGYWVARVADTP